ncbi:hypothetical protein Leryth_021217 [Lithospermum erythrorhizon]|nr:hypothetical protein Leryth_021217 [Lithospermum erythrorhizon]
MPVLPKYDGVGDPVAHCQNVRDLVKFVSKHDEVLCQAFPTTLEGRGRTWYDKLPVDRDFRHLMRIRQKNNETLREFVGRFNAEKTTVGHVEDQALVTSFVEGLKWDKFSEALATKDLTKITFSEILAMANAFSIQEDEREFKSGRGDIRDRIGPIVPKNESKKRKAHDRLGSYGTSQKRRLRATARLEVPSFY